MRSATSAPFGGRSGLNWLPHLPTSARTRPCSFIEQDRCACALPCSFIEQGQHSDDGHPIFLLLYSVFLLFPARAVIVAVRGGVQSREMRWKTRPGRIIGRLTILGLLRVNTRVLSSVGYRSCATGGTFMGMLLLRKCADPTEYIHR